MEQSDLGAYCLHARSIQSLVKASNCSRYQQMTVKVFNNEFTHTHRVSYMRAPLLLLNLSNEVRRRDQNARLCQAFITFSQQV